MKTDLNVINIGRVGETGASPPDSKRGDPGEGPSFKDALEAQADKADRLTPEASVELPKTLKFSNHAVERMSKRGITFTPDEMTRIEQAARKASGKGAKETLIFTDDTALIVDTKNNTIVTVMDKSALKENIFTNIDSTVVV